MIGTWRFSLRGALVVLAVAAFGGETLKYANHDWHAVVFVAVFLAVAASAVVALVDRGRRQALAIGFLDGTVGYGSLLRNFPTLKGVPRTSPPTVAELDAHVGLLPTTLALRLVFDQLSEAIYQNSVTHEQVRPSQLYSSQLQLAASFGSGAKGGSATSSPANAPMPQLFYVGERPERGSFMLVGHCLWAVLWGFICANLAGRIVAQRENRAHALLSDQQAGVADGRSCTSHVLAK